MITPVKLKDMFNKDRKPISNYLNLWAIEDNAVIGVDLQMSYVYSFTGVSVFSMSEQELNIFLNSIKSYLHSFADNITVSFVIKQTYGNKEKLQNYVDSVHTEDEFAGFIRDEKLKQYSNNDYAKRTLLMYITLYPDAIALSKYNTPSLFHLFKPNKKELEKLHTEQISKLDKIANAIIISIRQIGVEIKQLKEEELLVYFYKYLNPARSIKFDYNTAKYDKNLTLRSQICFNGADNTFSHLFIDGYYHRAINMVSRSSVINPYDIINYLKSINGEYCFTLNIDSYDQLSLEKPVKSKGIIGLVTAGFNPLKRDINAVMLHEDAFKMLEFAKVNNQKLYRISFCTVIRDLSLENLTKRQDEVLSAYRLFGEAEGVIDDGQHLFGFLNGLPGHSQFNLRKEIFHTEALSMFLPLNQSWQGTNESKMIFLTKDNELIGLDMFDPSLPAKHALLLGATGSGKSFTTNYILSNFFIESDKNHIIIVDIGGSYKKLVSLLGGEYFEVDNSGAYSFNPFPPKTVAVKNMDTMSMDSDILTFLQLFVHKLLKKESLEPKESLILETAIKETYKSCSGPVPTLQLLMKQLINYKDEDEEIKNIAKQFGKNLDWWVSGKYGAMLNKETSINPKARIIAFDLQKLQKETDLIPLIFFIIQNTIWDKLNDKSLQKIIVFDEAWSYFNSESSALLLENLYRTARKYNAAIYSISQSPTDFMDSKASSAVLSNSYIKFFLMLQKGHELLEKYGLIPEEIEEVKNLTSVRKKYSEVFIKFNKHSQVLRIQPNKCDYWICTTDPADETKINNIKSKKPKIKDIELLKILMEE